MLFIEMAETTSYPSWLCEWFKIDSPTRHKILLNNFDIFSKLS